MNYYPFMDSTFNSQAPTRNSVFTWRPRLLWLMTGKVQPTSEDFSASAKIRGRIPRRPPLTPQPTSTSSTAAPWSCSRRVHRTRRPPFPHPPPGSPIAHPHYQCGACGREGSRSVVRRHPLGQQFPRLWAATRRRHRVPVRRHPHPPPLFAPGNAVTSGGRKDCTAQPFIIE